MRSTSCSKLQNSELGVTRLNDEFVDQSSAISKPIPKTPEMPTPDGHFPAYSGASAIFGLRF